MILSDDKILNTPPHELLESIENSVPKIQSKNLSIARVYCLIELSKFQEISLNDIVILPKTLPKVSIKVLSGVFENFGFSFYFEIINRSSLDIFRNIAISAQFCSILKTITLEYVSPRDIASIKNIFTFILKNRDEIIKLSVDAACELIENEYKNGLKDFNSDFVLEVMKSGVISKPLFERIYTVQRKELFRRVLEIKSCSPRESEIIFCISTQEFHKDYCSYQDSDEIDTLQKIRNLFEEKIEHNEDISSISLYLSLYAMYEPLQSIKGLSTYERSRFPETLNTLIDISSETSNQLNTLEEKISSLSIIDDPDSKSVRSLYEESPYPKWYKTATRLTPNFESYLQMESLPKAKDLVNHLSEKPKILIAGCGTGQQPISMAMGMPYAKFTAIDISKRSIAYALKRTLDHGVKNIDYFHADILKIPEASRKFDLIACGGVLHHMASPEAGLKSLAKVLKPGGLMYIAVYSTAARRTISKHRKLINAQKIAPTVENIREYRARIVTSKLEEASPVFFRDFYNLHECRDLLFHTHEKTYSWTEVKDLVSSANLEIVKTVVPPEYEALFKEKSDTESEVDIIALEKFEKEHPDTWRSMMFFWCKKPLSNLEEKPI